MYNKLSGAVATPNLPTLIFISSGKKNRDIPKNRKKIIMELRFADNPIKLEKILVFEVFKQQLYNKI